MEALILLSFYDDRWFFFGWLSRFEIWHIHKDSKFSHIMFFMAYL